MRKLAVLCVAVLGVVLAVGVPARAQQAPNFVNFDSVAPNPVEAGTPVAVQVSYTMQTVDSPLVQITGSVSAGTINGFGISPPVTCNPQPTDYACAGMTAGTVYQVTYQIDTAGLADGTTITITAGETQFGATQQTTVQVESQQPPDTEPPDTEPPDTEPPDTEPPDTEPPGTDPADTDPADTDPADTDPADTDPADTSETGSTTTTEAAATTTASGTTSGQLPSTGPGLTSLTSALLGGLLLAAGGVALRLARRS